MNNTVVYREVVRSIPTAHQSTPHFSANLLLCKVCKADFNFGAPKCLQANFVIIQVLMVLKNKIATVMTTVNIFWYKPRNYVLHRRVITMD